MVGYHKSSAPLSLLPFRLEINVDLTPINLTGSIAHNFAFPNDFTKSLGVFSGTRAKLSWR